MYVPSMESTQRFNYGCNAEANAIEKKKGKRKQQKNSRNENEEKIQCTARKTIHGMAKLRVNESDRAAVVVAAKKLNEQAHTHSYE